MNPLRSLCSATCMLACFIAFGGSSAMAATDIATLKTDDRISGEVQITGDRVFPLPPGEWIVAGVREGVGHKAQWPWQEVVLAQVKGKVISRMVLLNPAQSVRWKGYQPDKSCSNSRNFSSKVLKNSDGGDQSCWYVGAWCTRKTDDENNNFYRKSLNELARRDGLYQPAALIGYRVVLADSKSRMRYVTTINADMVLPATTEKGMWISDDWKADVVAKDPLRTAVLEELTKQAAAWHKKLEAQWKN